MVLLFIYLINYFYIPDPTKSQLRKRENIKY